MEERKSVKRLVLRSKISKVLGKMFVYIMLISLAYLLLYPLIYIITTVFRSVADLNNPAVVWITRTYTWQHLLKAVDKLDFWKTFGYTMSLVLPCAVLQTISCSLAGYGFARFKFKGQGILFAILVLLIIVPEQTILIPLYGVIQSMGLLNSVAAFWVQALLGMSFKSGLFIFIFRQFFKGIPKELYEAARIDGCGQFGIYARIMLPNVIPAIVTVFFFSFVWHWNENYLTKFVLTKERTLAYLVDATSSLVKTSGGNIMEVQAMVQAGSLLLLFPTLLLFFILQRHLREGIARSGIVG